MRLFKKSKKIYNSDAPLQVLIDVYENEDLSKLIISGNPSEVELKKSFEKIQYDIIDITGGINDINSAWFNFNFSYTKIVKENINNKLRKIKDLQPLKIKTNENTKDFILYLDELNNLYKNFKVPIYSFVKNFEIEFKKIYDSLPTENILNFTKSINRWNTYEDYYNEIIKLKIDSKTASVLISDYFIKNLIEVRDGFVNDIKEYHSILSKAYSNNDKNLQYIFDRKILFDSNNLQKDFKTDSNLRSEVASLSQFLKYQINPKIISIKDFYYLVKNVNETAKRANLEAEKSRPQEA